MGRILIVEDSATQAIAIRIRLERAGYHVDCAEHGAVAVAAMQSQLPDLVLTDLHMPEMNGLELVEHIRAEHPSVPVVLMTADGSEEIAAQALRTGAASYIPKKHLDRDLLPVIADIVTMIDQLRGQDLVTGAIVSSETVFEFGNNYDLASKLVAQLEKDLQRLDYDDENGVFRVVLALKEAVVNAIEHGNLELDSNMRDIDENNYHKLAKQRQQQEPYASRKIQLHSRISPTQVMFVIRDQGPGFDPGKIPDPTDPENLTRGHGRGLMLIQSFMDHVEHNQQGNEITLIKYRNPPSEGDNS